MHISSVSILLSLGGKCLLNWVLVFLQKKQICRSFLGVFGVSLAVVDVAATVSIFTIYIYGSEFVTLFGYLMTQYDVCLLVQMVGQISRVLQWPVAVLAFADHFCTVTQRLQTATYWQKGIIYLFMTVFLWFLTALYIILQYDFIPDVSKPDTLRCGIVQSFQILHMTLLLLFVLVCVVTGTMKLKVLIGR